MHCRITLNILALFSHIYSTFGQGSAKSIDFCQLLPDRGPCRESHKRWYYDVRTDNCTVFIYGGCLGNQNSFDGPERCETTCRRSKNVVALPFGFTWPASAGIGLTLSDDQTPGHRSNALLGVDGRGNSNVLLSSPSLDDCDQPLQRGFCSSFIPRWHHNGSSCELFYYSGCGGNGNNFMTRESCQERCQLRSDDPLQPSTAVTQPAGQTACQSRPKRGNCRSALIRWYFDSDTSRCLEFVYSGCNGNENNYPSQQECEQRCSRVSTTVGLRGIDPDLRLRQGPGRSLSGTNPSSNVLLPGGAKGPDQQADAGVKAADAPGLENGWRLPSANGPASGEAAGTEAAFAQNVPSRCVAEPERGPCLVDMERWYYDTKNGNCRPFYYGGCQGNANRFSSRKECETICATTAVSVAPVNNDAEVCSLEPATGNCRSAFKRFYFDPARSQCREFTYGGCDGNGNNFKTIEECETRCQANVPGQSGPGEPDRPGQTVGGPGVGLRSSENRPLKCHLPSETGPCRASLKRWFFNGQSCERFTYGGCRGNDNNFDSLEQCQAECGNSVTSRGPNNIMVRTDSGISDPLPSEICQQPPDSGSCTGSIPRVFYDLTTGLCKPFTYGGCDGNSNNFRSVSECEASCNTVRIRASNSSVPGVCTLPAERGHCRAFIPSYFHDIRDGMCKMFYYGGCQGNDNRFQSRQECEDVCAAGSGPAFAFGGGLERSALRGLNTLDSASAMGRSAGSKCSPFCDPPSVLISQKACDLPAEPGNCLAMIPSYYFDKEFSQCRQFIYGGCGGNANRFASIEDCHNVCQMPHLSRAVYPQVVSNLPKNPDCLLTPETGLCKGRFRLWSFDATQQTCTPFIYGGCGGNGNRFSNREECLHQCASFMMLDNSNMMRLQQINAARQFSGAMLLKDRRAF